MKIFSKAASFTLITGILLLGCATPPRGRSVLLLEEVADQPVYKEDIGYPLDENQRIEFFWAKPEGKGPWPTLVFLHNHQSPQRPGGRDFVRAGLVRKYAKTGTLAVAISLPGYGKSDGKSDFGGSQSQIAVREVIKYLQKMEFSRLDRVVLWGLGGGATAAALTAASETEISGVILLHPVLEPGKLYEKLKSSGKPNQMAYASEIEEQMGTSDEAFASHSLIAAAEKIRAPVLAVFGEKDMKADPERADDFVRKVTTQGGWAKAYVLPGYSDIIPIDARNEKLMPFLNRVLYRPE